MIGSLLYLPKAKKLFESCFMNLQENISQKNQNFMMHGWTRVHGGGGVGSGSEKGILVVIYLMKPYLELRFKEKDDIYLELF